MYVYLDLIIKTSGLFVKTKNQKEEMSTSAPLSGWSTITDAWYGLIQGFRCYLYLFYFYSLLCFTFTQEPFSVVRSETFNNYIIIII